MAVTLLLAASLVLMYVAAFLALRLIRVTGRSAAWLLIASAVTLFAVRRTILLVRVLLEHDSFPLDFTTEFISLVISVLLVAGIALIKPLFVALRESKRSLTAPSKAAKRSGCFSPTGTTENARPRNILHRVVLPFYGPGRLAGLTIFL